MPHSLPQIILGYREWIDLPELGITPIHAKLDTGARSSALHVVTLEQFEKKGEQWVRFEVDPYPKRPDVLVTAEAPLADERVVKNSGGRGELRAVIRTSLAIAGREWKCDLTLTSRHNMRFRMLVGREAMAGRILVDPRRSHLAGVPRMEKKR